MKLQTKQTKSKVTLINIILLIIFFSSLFFFYIDIQVMERKDEIICLISFIFLIYLSYLGCPFFRYDSEGETLIFQNQKALPFSILVKESQSDFPKRKLVKFNIEKKFLFKKKLEIYITSKRVSTGMSKVSFDISYLSAKEIKNITISLNKVIKENEKYVEPNNSVTFE